MVGGATKNASQGNCFIMSDMGYVIIMKKCPERRIKSIENTLVVE